MKRIVELLLIIVLCLNLQNLFAQVDMDSPTLPDECKAKDERIPVLLLATYHMANPGADRFNLESDDVLSPKRQAEIKTLVESLAEFRPTKIVTEDAFSQDSSNEVRYKKYLAGELELTRNEIDQVAYRLAKKMGHKKVYPIDYKIGLKDEKMGKLISENKEFQALMREAQGYGNSVMSTFAEWLSKSTVSEMLYKINRPQTLQKALEPYFIYGVNIVKGNDYGGAEFVLDWYKRNLFIFANLHKVSSEGDRVFLLFGQSHIPVIQQFVEDSPFFCVENVLPYLK